MSYFAHDGRSVPYSWRFLLGGEMWVVKVSYHPQEKGTPNVIERTIKVGKFTKGFVFV